jgi:hypothetical protein
MKKIHRENGSLAERLLRELGVTDPQDIDLEAIAYYRGASVKYRPLDGCEARILGYKDKAIITVDPRTTSGRQRFSLGHELGHWEYHREQSLICRSEDIGNHAGTTPATERTADQYAADILMPDYLFRPRAMAYPTANFTAVGELAEQFRTSRIATAIRFVEKGPLPAVLVCHGLEGRKWFKRSRHVPSSLFPRKELDSDSFAFDVLRGEKRESGVHVMDADTWFEHWKAKEYELYEETVKTGDTEILTLLTWKDESMLEEIT